MSKQESKMFGKIVNVEDIHDLEYVYFYPDENSQMSVCNAYSTEYPDNGMKPGTMYDLGEISDDTTLELAKPDNLNTINTWIFSFDIGDTVPIITWPELITNWFDGAEPTLAQNAHYEVSISNGYAVCNETTNI